jgi:uncharacterized protein (DUF1697 family)
VATHAAFLRGINVGGRRVKGPDLVAAFEALGFEDVACFRASGNVVFAAQGAASAIEKRIAGGLEKELGFESKAFVRTAEQLRAIAGFEPFDPKLVASSPGKLQVSFLDRKPARKAADAVLELASDQDRLMLEGTELYWLPSGGLMDSELDLRAVERHVGVDTRRTMGTIEQMTVKFFERSEP